MIEAKEKVCVWGGEDRCSSATHRFLIRKIKLQEVKKKKARFVRLEDRKGSLSLTIMLNEGEEKMSVPPPKKKEKMKKKDQVCLFFSPSMAREFTVCTATVRNAGHHCVNSLFFFSSTTDRRSNDTIAGNHMKRAHCFSGASAHAGKEKQERNLSKQVNQPRTHLERKKKGRKTQAKPLKGFT